MGRREQGKDWRVLGFVRKDLGMIVEGKGSTDCLWALTNQRRNLTYQNMHFLFIPALTSRLIAIQSLIAYNYY